MMTQKLEKQKLERSAESYLDAHFEKLEGAQSAQSAQTEGGGTIV